SEAPLTTAKYNWAVATNDRCSHAVDRAYNVIAGPPTPAVTFMNPDRPPAATPPPRPRKTRIRSELTTARMARNATEPTTTDNTGPETVRANQAPGAIATAAGTARSA